MKTRQIRYIFGLLVTVLLFNACGLTVKGRPVIGLTEKSERTVCVYEEKDTRPPQWAVPVKRAGLPNLHKVSHSLYRGGQPKKEGVKHLKELGIKTIIDFTGEDREKGLFTDNHFNYVSIHMKASSPRKEGYRKYLKIVTDPANHPVFVHCRHGADRTGAAVAIYRVKVQGWSVSDAIAEMILGCYRFHRQYAHILPKFVREFVR